MKYLKWLLIPALCWGQLTVKYPPAYPDTTTLNDSALFPVWHKNNLANPSAGGHYNKVRFSVLKTLTGLQKSQFVAGSGIRIDTGANITITNIGAGSTVTLGYVDSILTRRLTGLTCLHYAYNATHDTLSIDTTSCIATKAYAASVASAARAAAKLHTDSLHALDSTALAGKQPSGDYATRQNVKDTLNDSMTTVHNLLSGKQAAGTYYGPTDTTSTLATQSKTKKLISDSLAAHPGGAGGKSSAADIRDSLTFPPADSNVVAGKAVLLGDNIYEGKQTFGYSGNPPIILSPSNNISTQNPAFAVGIDTGTSSGKFCFLDKDQALQCLVKESEADRTTPVLLGDHDTDVSYITNSIVFLAQGITTRTRNINLPAADELTHPVTYQFINTIHPNEVDYSANQGYASAAVLCGYGACPWSSITYTHTPNDGDNSYGKRTSIVWDSAPSDSGKVLTACPTGPQWGPCPE